MNFLPEERTEEGSEEVGLLNAKQKWTRSAREMIPDTHTDTTCMSVILQIGERETYRTPEPFRVFQSVLSSMHRKIDHSDNSLGDPAPQTPKYSLPDPYPSLT